MRGAAMCRPRSRKFSRMSLKGAFDPLRRYKPCAIRLRAFIDPLQLPSCSGRRMA
jgi:hypothetical protein